MKKKVLRQGYTTGACAQAAVKAAMQMLLSGEPVSKIQAELPGGRQLTLPVFDASIQFYDSTGWRRPFSASCAVKKDSGDDPDITNGVLVYGRVSWSDTPGIVIEGGEGIGRVTKPGLDQPVGAAAVNRVPRQMIEREVRHALEEAESSGGICVELSIPGGKELSLRTFNPRLGIEGGLSILGTSGIVEPMSQQALIETIRAEMRIKRAQGESCLVITPGNYGLDFLKSAYNIEEADVIKCSNFIGQSIDMAIEEGFERMVLAGHIGKLIKVSGGIMNTHSGWADCRMELFAAAALRAGVSAERAREFLECITTEEALAKCAEKERLGIMEQIIKSLEKHLAYRADGEIETGAVVYSNACGILGRTENAERLLRIYCKEM